MRSDRKKSLQKEGQAQERLWPGLFRNRWEQGALLAVLVLLVYLPSLQAGFVWDDDALVTDNPLLGDARGLWRIWTEPGASPQGHYWPLVHTSFWLEHWGWGSHALGYHLTNGVLHTLNVILIWLLLVRLRVPGAWFAALIFAIHPVHVESVTWITERKNVLSVFFYLCAFLAYERFHREREGKFYAASLGLFIAALLSKSIAISLPLALLVWLWWKDGKWGRKDLLAILPLLAIAALSALLYVSVFQRSVSYHSGLTLPERLILAGRTLWFYAGQVAWPAKLMAIYPRWTLDAGALGQYLYPGGVVAALLLLGAFRDRLGRGPLACALYFCITLGPLLGLLDMGPYMEISYVTDHALYPASLGLIVLFTGGIANWLRRQSRVEWISAGALGGCLVVALAGLTWRHERQFQDMETLFTHSLKMNPQAFAAHNNLGFALMRQGKIEQARQQFAKALELRPDFPAANYNMGIVLNLSGDSEGAVVHFSKALETRPAHVETLINLGLALFRQGKYSEALHHLQRAVEKAPDNVQARKNLGAALAETGDLSGAVEQFRAALERAPDDADLRFNLARALARTGDLANAEKEYLQVLEANPDDGEARYQLAIALDSQGKQPDAAEELEKILAESPEDARALTRLAWLKATASEAGIRNGTEAVRLAEKANELTRGQQPTVLDTLAAACAEAGQWNRAVKTAKDAENAARQAGMESFAQEIEQRRMQYERREAAGDKHVPSPLEGEG